MEGRRDWWVHSHLWWDTTASMCVWIMDWTRLSIDGRRIRDVIDRVSSLLHNYLLVIKFLFLCFGSAGNWKLGILISLEYLTNSIVFRWLKWSIMISHCDWVNWRIICGTSTLSIPIIWKMVFRSTSIIFFNQQTNWPTRALPDPPWVRNSRLLSPPSTYLQRWR